MTTRLLINPRSSLFFFVILVFQNDCCVCIRSISICTPRPRVSLSDRTSSFFFFVILVFQNYCCVCKYEVLVHVYLGQGFLHHVALLSLLKIHTFWVRYSLPTIVSSSHQLCRANNNGWCAPLSARSVSFCASGSLAGAAACSGGRTRARDAPKPGMVKQQLQSTTGRKAGASGFTRPPLVLVFFLVVFCCCCCSSGIGRV